MKNKNNNLSIIFGRRIAIDEKEPVGLFIVNNITKEVLFELVEMEEMFIKKFNDQLKYLLTLNLEKKYFITGYFYIKEKNGIMQTSEPLKLSQDIELALWESIPLGCI